MLAAVCATDDRRSVSPRVCDRERVRVALSGLYKGSATVGRSAEKNLLYASRGSRGASDDESVEIKTELKRNLGFKVE